MACQEETLVIALSPVVHENHPVHPPHCSSYPYFHVMLIFPRISTTEMTTATIFAMAAIWLVICFARRLKLRAPFISVAFVTSYGGL